LYSGHEGGNIAWRVNDGDTPDKATVGLNRRHGSTDPKLFFFRLLTKPSWKTPVSDGQKIPYYVIKMHDNDEYCMAFKPDDAEQPVFERCATDESSENFRRQTFELRIRE
jgi:hypothetical protein